MAHSIIQVSGKKPKTSAALTRLQEYIEKRAARAREEAEPAAWQAVRDDLRQSLTPENHARWIENVQVRQEGDTLILGSPSDFDRRWLQRGLDRHIVASLQRTGYGHLQPRYAVAEPATPPDPNAPRVIMSRDDWAAYTQHRLDELGITPRQGKQSERYNSPLAIHYTLTASPSWFREHPDQKDAWVDHSAGFIRQLHGEAQILGIVLHDHQSTPHLHIVAIPIDARGRLSASSFTRTPEQLEALHTQYNRYLRDHGLPLARGENARLERALAAAPPDVQQRAIHADDIPLAEVLERLEAERDGRDPHRWLIGDRLIQVHADEQGFTEVSPHGAEEGHGAIDLVIRLRQEGRTPLEEHDLAVEYLAALHPERMPGGAPPLVPHAPEPRRHAPLERQSMPFGQEMRWEAGQFILVDTPAEAVQALGTAKGWGRVAVADRPEALPVDEMDEALARGWIVDVAGRSDALWEAVQERYADLTDGAGRQVWHSGAPGTAQAKAVERALEVERGPEIGPEMLMDA